MVSEMVYLSKNGLPSQISSNFLTLSCRILTSFSCTMIQEIFSLAALKETEGFFQARAIVILAPSNIK